MHAKMLLPELRPALIAIGFLLMPAGLFDIPLKSSTLAAGFFAAFAVYLADHRLPDKEAYTWPLILLCSAAFGIAGVMSRQMALAGILCYIVLALSYVLPLFPGPKRLQDFPLARLLAVVGGWAGIPLLLHAFPHTLSALIYLAGIGALMLPAVMWSDQADAVEDQTAGRLTWSMRQSPRRRLILTRAALTLSLLCFSLPGLRLMLPAPLLYWAASPGLNRHPEYADWILLWPLLGSVINQVV